MLATLYDFIISIYVNVNVNVNVNINVNINVMCWDLSKNMTLLNISLTHYHKIIRDKGFELIGLDGLTWKIKTHLIAFE